MDPGVGRCDVRRSGGGCTVHGGHRERRLATDQVQEPLVAVAAAQLSSDDSLVVHGRGCCWPDPGRQREPVGDTVDAGRVRHAHVLVAGPVVHRTGTRVSGSPRDAVEESAGVGVARAVGGGRAGVLVEGPPADLVGRTAAGGSCGVGGRQAGAVSGGDGHVGPCASVRPRAPLPDESGVADRLWHRHLVFETHQRFEVERQHLGDLVDRAGDSGDVGFDGACHLLWQQRDRGGRGEPVTVDGGQVHAVARLTFPPVPRGFDR